MKKNARKILAGGGVIAIAFLGWLTGVVLSAPPYTVYNHSGTNEMTQLRSDLADYLADKLKKERQASTLVDVAVQNPTVESNGTVKFPYILAFNEPVDGHDTTSWVQATAVLEKNHDAWKVVKVNTERESVVYADAEVVTPKGE